MGGEGGGGVGGEAWLVSECTDIVKLIKGVVE